MLPRPVVRGRKNPLYLGFASRLRRARSSAGLSFTALAHKAGISSAKTTSALERGDNVPRVDTVEKLAHALMLSPGMLAFGIAAPWNPPATLLCEKLSQRLRAIRLERSHSLREVGRRSETSGNLIKMIEMGTMPSIDTLENIAKSLDISPAWLAYGLGPMSVLRRSPRRQEHEEPRVT